MESFEDAIPAPITRWQRWRLGRRAVPGVVVLEPLGHLRERSSYTLVRCAFVGLGLARVGGRWLLLPGRLVRVLSVGGRPPEGRRPVYIQRLLRWKHIPWPEDGRLKVVLYTIKGTLRTELVLEETVRPARPRDLTLERPDSAALRAALPRTVGLDTPKVSVPEAAPGITVPALELRVPAVVRARLRPPGP
jgi:hypothetical protein